MPRYIQEGNERQIAEIREHEAELAKLLQMPTRWMAVPSFVEHMASDPWGSVWFSAKMMQAFQGHTEEHFARSVERAAIDNLHVVHGGRVVLVDRAGRVWVCSDARPAVLLCYDSKEKTWGESRRATGDESLPANLTEHQYASGEFKEAFEDAAGNLYFVSGASVRLGMGITRRSRDGKWTFDLLEPLDSGHEMLLARGVRFTEQIGGRVVITPKQSHAALAPGDRIIYYFDGSRWVRSDPRVCKRHDLAWVAPMPDGSIVTACSAASRTTWTYWPPDLLAKQLDGAEQLIAQLADADPQERERAVAALDAMGPHMLPALRTRMEADTSPELRSRLGDVVRAVEAIDEPNHEGARLAGRFEVSGVGVLSRPSLGGLRLEVDSCTDPQTGQKWEDALVTMGSDRTWGATQIPLDQWYAAGLQMAAEDCLEDSAGGIWLPGGLRADTQSANRVVAVPPQGINIIETLFETAGGQVCFKSGQGYVLYDPLAPEGKGDLPQQIIAGQAIYLVHGQAWAQMLMHVPATVERLDKPGEPVRLPFEHMDGTVFAVLPLRGALLVQVYSERTAMGNRMMLWDGQNWLGPAPLMDLVKPRARFFAEAAGEDFAAVGPEERVRLAGDGNGGLWVANDLFELVNGGAFPGQAAPRLDEFPNQKHVRRFEYYDGIAWHDVWAELKQQDPRYAGQILRAVDGGKAILIETEKRDAVLLAAYDGQQVRAKKLMELDNREAGPLARRWARSSSGELWFESGRKPLQLLRYLNGAITAMPVQGQLLLGDSKGRIWRVDAGDRLNVKIGDAWSQRSIAGLKQGICAMVEAPDGRLWLLYPQGVSQIEVQGSAGDAAIREVGRWKWDTEKSSFAGVFCDSRNGLWLCTEGTRHARYILPPARPSAAPSGNAPHNDPEATPARPPVQ